MCVYRKRLIRNTEIRDTFDYYYVFSLLKRYYQLTSHLTSAVGCRGARISFVCLHLSFQAVSASSFSLTPYLLLLVLVSCFLPSSVSLVHNVCTTFHASVQVNRSLILRLVSRETMAIEVTIGECRVSVCRACIKVSGYQDIRILEYYDNMIRILRQQDQGPDSAL